MLHFSTVSTPRHSSMLLSCIIPVTFLNYVRAYILLLYRHYRIPITMWSSYFPILVQKQRNNHTHLYPLTFTSVVSFRKAYVRLIFSVKRTSVWYINCIPNRYANFICVNFKHISSIKSSRHLLSFVCKFQMFI